MVRTLGRYPLVPQPQKLKRSVRARHPNDLAALCIRHEVIGNVKIEGRWIRADVGLKRERTERLIGCVNENIRTTNASAAVAANQQVIAAVVPEHQWRFA